MAENNNYKGYFCSKCKRIPLIQIIPKADSLNILSLCKCRKQYENIDTFDKNYYKTDIPFDNISKESIMAIPQEFKEENIPTIIEKFNKTKEEMDNHSKEIKEKMNDYIKIKDPEKLNDKYEKYNTINNKIISIIEQFLDSYKKLKDNSSIILNILNNSSFNTNYKKTPNNYLLNSSPDVYYQQSIKYYQNEYIISEASIPEQLKEKVYWSPSNTVTCFLELSNKIYASNCRKNPNIILYNLNDLNSKIKICIKAHSGNVNWIIKTNNNNLITCGDDGIIKIWPLISDNIFSEIDKSKTDEKSPNLIIYNLNPLYEYQSEFKEMNEIKKMVNINENSFVAISDKCIFLFSYSIKDGKDNINTNINILKKVDNMELIDIILIEKTNKEKLIGAYSNKKLYLLNCHNLEVIKEMDINNCPEKNCLIQLNDNEIMISQKDPEPNLIVVDINNWKIKSTFNNNKFTDYLFKLKDGTIIQSGPKGIWRFMINNFKELPILYKPFNDTEFDYPYECYEKISCLKDIGDGNLMMCIVVGKMAICNLIFL